LSCMATCTRQRHRRNHFRCTRRVSPWVCPKITKLHPREMENPIRGGDTSSMTSSSRNSDGSAQSQTSVCKVVNFVHDELYGLLIQREGIERRIRNLRQVVNGLRRFAGQPVFRSLSDQRLRSEELDTQRDGRKVPSQVSHQLGLERVNLRRACRIALMEATGPASLEEIHSRIARRGTCPTISWELAHPLLVGALNGMTENGEVRCLASGSSVRWQRIESSNEEGTTFEVQNGNPSLIDKRRDV
jgi:hypothetical protein